MTGPLELTELTRLGVEQKALLDHVKTRFDATCKLLREALGAPGRKWSISADGVDLGDAQLTKPAKAARIDVPMFLPWVMEHHGTEVVLEWQPAPGMTWQDVAAELYEADPDVMGRIVIRVPGVQPAFATRICKEAEAGGALPPGVVLTAGTPSLRVAPSAASRAVAAARIAGIVPELEGTDQ